MYILHMCEHTVGDSERDQLPHVAVLCSDFLLFVLQSHSSLDTGFVTSILSLLRGDFMR